MTMFASRWKLLAAAAATLGIGALSACGDGGTEPLPVPPPPLTALRIALNTPQSDDGAVVVTIRGPNLSDVQVASGTYLAYTRTVGQATRVIVIGDLTAGPLLTAKVGAGHQLADYSAVVEQVAMRSDALRGDVSQYRLTVTPGQ